MSAAAVVVPIVPVINPKRILYVTDFSEGSTQAWPVVCSIARCYRAQIFVTHVFPLPHAYAGKTGSLVQFDEKREGMKQLAELVKSNLAGCRGNQS